MPREPETCAGILAACLASGPCAVPSRHVQLWVVPRPVRCPGCGSGEDGVTAPTGENYWERRGGEEGWVWGCNVTCHTHKPFVPCVARQTVK
eukprot:7119530-Pyramimonas_sp.AAC.1